MLKSGVMRFSSNQQDDDDEEVVVVVVSKEDYDVWMVKKWIAVTHC